VLAMLENSMSFLTAVHLDTHRTRQKSGAGEMEATMRWYHYVAYFFGGAFLANTLPHLGKWISGHPFQSPFASPPGEGFPRRRLTCCGACSTWPSATCSSVAWANSICAGTRHVLVLGAGIVFISVMLARGFGRFHGGL